MIIMVLRAVAAADNDIISRAIPRADRKYGTVYTGKFRRSFRTEDVRTRMPAGAAVAVVVPAIHIVVAIRERKGQRFAEDRKIFLDRKSTRLNSSHRL